jgi:hypothetical protein
LFAPILVKEPAAEKVLTKVEYKKSRIPLAHIQTSDCFAFDLIVREKVIDFDDFECVQRDRQKREKVIKKEYFFCPDNLPDNYDIFVSTETKNLLKNKNQRSNPFNYPVGITAYENFFSHEELSQIERKIEETEEKCEVRAYLPMTA